MPHPNPTSIQNTVLPCFFFVNERPEAKRELSFQQEQAWIEKKGFLIERSGSLTLRKKKDVWCVEAERGFVFAKKKQGHKKKKILFSLLPLPFFFPERAHPPH